tara:strand:- start:217 stop:1284 length:1068 start_codon:yes stop_codon:yes gene_type:complete
MKIIFNNTIFFSQKFGGISRYFVSLAEELLKKNIKLKIVAPINKNNLLKKIPTNSKFSFYFQRYPILKIFEKFNNYLSKMIIKNFKPDIFHETYYSNFNYDDIEAKKIITVYDLIHEKFPEYFSNEKINEKKNIKNYDHYICISKNTKKDLIEFYKIPEKKISVIYLSGSHYRNLKASNYSKNISRQNFFLYVGSRENYKNFNLIIECFKKYEYLQNFKIVCFGGGKFTNSEVENFAGLKVEHIEGNDQELIDLYCNAICLLLPSKYEGFGIPMLEAMELSCPVLSSSTEALREIGDDAALYFDPESCHELKKKIELIIHDSEIRSSLIKKGLKRANFFSWKKCSDQTFEVYNLL